MLHHPPPSPAVLSAYVFCGSQRFLLLLFRATHLAQLSSRAQRFVNVVPYLRTTLLAAATLPHAPNRLPLDLAAILN